MYLLDVIVFYIGLLQVTLVGLVYNKEERASDVNFTLDDGTGRVVCKRWQYFAPNMNLINKHLSCVVGKF